MICTSFRTIAVAARGTSHIAHGLPCQDAVLTVEVADANGTKWTVAGLADGLGSVPHADIGARLAVTACCQFVEYVLKNNVSFDMSELMSLAIRHTRGVIKGVASKQSRTFQDYGTTLLCCIVGPQICGMAHIGDGAIFFRRSPAEAQEPDDWELAFPGETHEYANYVDPLTADDALEKVRIRVLGTGIRSVVITSDGLEPLIVKPGTDSIHPRFLDRLEDQLQCSTAGQQQDITSGLQQLIESPAVTDRTDDDVSLVAVHQPSANP